MLSHWLARHVDNEELRTTMESAHTSDLGPEGQEAVNELRAELGHVDGRGDVERAVRETLEALALGL